MVIKFNIIKKEKYFIKEHGRTINSMDGDVFIIKIRKKVK